ncbi:hypothetical protein BON30_46325 [Cystobacter ferrugineus]|uniref:C2 domain-containing protein n=1 Tax=Cystobacter ferrugineus TaxID=83449 RepID=A0A1L9AVA1_9BACT|nr:hypothetical protein BON30_46325 [Cystobacter ferrugineus]
MAASVRKAHACAGIQDWYCALTEAEFALGLDASNQELAAFRAEAARSFSRALLRRSRDEAAHRQFHSALEQFQKAIQVANGDPQLLEEAKQVRAEIVELGGQEAERLRERKEYPESIALLRQLANADGSRWERLREVEAEYARHLEAEYERLAREGDDALAQKQWDEAREKYEAALRAKAGGRAEPLARYTRGMAQGESALTRRDFTASAEGYRQAIQSGLDRDGYAAAQLARVAVRPYAIRVRSVLAMPTRPDGNPWVGRPHPMLGNLIKLGAKMTMGPVGAAVTRTIIDSARQVPPENRPTLSVIVSRPDGEQLKTPSRNGLYVVYDSSLVISSNHFDERRITFHVVHADGARRDDVGAVDVPLGELLANGGAAMRDHSIAALELLAEPVDGQVDGLFAEMIPISDDNNRAPDFSRPSAHATAFRLTRVQARVAVGDYQNEMGLDGSPDPVVEIEQAGHVVYRSPQAQDDHQVDWGLKAVNLFVEPGEQLVVRVWDADASSDDQVLAAYLPSHQLNTGTFQVRTKAGSFVNLLFEPRRTEAPRAMAQVQ